MNPTELFAKHGFLYPEGLIMAFIGGSTQHGATLGCGATERDSGKTHESKCYCHDDQGSGYTYEDEYGECEFCEGHFTDGTVICWDSSNTPRVCPGQSSDTDWYGIFIPPKEKSLGIDSYEHFVFPGDVSHRSRGDRDTNELDIALHSLQKWAGMACKGNPTTLSFLFANPEFPAKQSILCLRCNGLEKAPQHEPAIDTGHDFIPYKSSSWWGRVTDSTQLFLAKSHYKPFLYYAKDQMERLLGLRGQKNINRDYLVDQYGYDTKYAMHIIRLMSEAKELMEYGGITYPRPEVELLKDIRRGKYKLSEINEMGNQLNSEVIIAAERSTLPEAVDRKKIGTLIADIHLDFYRR